MYADDVVFYVAHKNHCQSCTLLQEDANLVYNWFTKSGLCINTDAYCLASNRVTSQITLIYPWEATPWA